MSVVGETAVYQEGILQDTMII